MDAEIQRRLEQKVQDAAASSDARRLADLLANGDESFAFGVQVGRIYNAFYYQSRRILDRSPTPAEFEEFLKFVSEKRLELAGSR